jgi:hypothetical protein
MRKLNVHTVASLEKEARLNSFGGLWQTPSATSRHVPLPSRLLPAESSLAFYAVLSCKAYRVLARETPSELSTILPIKSW